MAANTERCTVCGGTGWAVSTREGVEFVVRCACRGAVSAERVLRACRIPSRYRHCTIEGFEVWSSLPESRRQQFNARRRTREFVDLYPGVERGLLFMGSVGTGKTHLAVAALRELAFVKGLRGLYVNAVDLVQQLQISFDGGGPSREAILGPVTDADVLVLDEVGTGRLTDWVRDLLYYVINSRYMARRLTIVTTNYRDETPARPAGPQNLDAVVAVPRPPDRYEETLADRISERLRSRLHEMCDVVELYGEDYRARRSARPGSPR
ncbi:MAG TPA: ATP-binding protein, partial [Thermoanaerobaculaceae bacterium]|nr:ATP-binding protein [Thermoanaerobaculaceae bacterium]